MQSFVSKTVCNVMKLFFHSSLVNNSEMTNRAGKATKNVKSRYKPSKGFSHTRHKCGECFYEKLVCENSKTEKVVLLLHGGSFKIRLIDMYRRIAEKYSRLLGGAAVYSVDYRTFPEYKFPCQLEDCVCVYKELLKQGIETENIIIVGDSAGANLALALPLYLRDNGCKLPFHIVAISLWGDLTAASKVREKNAHKDPLYGIARRKKTEDYLDYLHRPSAYAREIDDRTNPYVSPCFGSFEDFPPVTLICGEAELDEGDSDVVFEKMQKQKIDVKLYKFEGMFHDFILLGFLPESKKAYKLIAERITDKE